MSTRGTHLFADYLGCDAKILADPAKLVELLLDAARAAGATVVAQETHALPSGGFCSVAVLKESHLMVRTSPDEESASADFFTCGEWIPDGPM